MINPFAVLGLKPGVSSKSIRRRYRLLAGKWHPDRNPDKPREAERRFKEIAEAYRLLSSKVQRQVWTHRSKASTKRKWYKKNYWDRLREDTENPASQIKLVLHDLIESRTKEGMERFLKISQWESFELERCIEGREYMDCAFLLAEEFERREEFEKAYDYYRRVYWKQHRHPMMPYYKIETGERLIHILRDRWPRQLDAKKRVSCLAKCLADVKSKGQWKQLMTELSDGAFRLGNHAMACRAARALKRRGYSIKTLEIEKMGLVSRY